MLAAFVFRHQDEDVSAVNHGRDGRSGNGFVERGVTKCRQNVMSEKDTFAIMMIWRGNMETIKMMRGDSCIVFVSLTQDDVPITPGMVSDVEICIGDEIRKTYSGGTVGYDEEAGEWYLKPKQEETLGLAPGKHDVIARVKYLTSGDADVKGVFLGQVVMRDIHSGEVL